MLRKRSLVKLLILVPILWIIAMIIVNLSDNSSSNSQLVAEKARLSELLRRNAELMRHQQDTNEENSRKLAEGAEKAKGELNKDDHDHPAEERAKAEEQLKAKAGLIQVQAPVEHNPNAPGELGKPVIIDKDKLSPEERVKFDKGWTNNAFNAYASDMISIHRSLADIRDPACKTVKWYDPLPTTSVIVIFHNEAWSVLLRTVHSVIDRSDPKLLKEVILVDDFSDFRKFNF
jgi:polypeptide N-acetylgalactosaminyltransferase